MCGNEVPTTEVYEEELARRLIDALAHSSVTGNRAFILSPDEIDSVVIDGEFDMRKVVKLLLSGGPFIGLLHEHVSGD